MSTPNPEYRAEPIASASNTPPKRLLFGIDHKLRVWDRVARGVPDPFVSK